MDKKVHLKKILEESNYSLDSLAKKLGVSSQMLYKNITASKPPIYFILTLEVLLERRLDAFFPAIYNAPEYTEKIEQIRRFSKSYVEITEKVMGLLNIAAQMCIRTDEPTERAAIERFIKKKMDRLEELQKFMWGKEEANLAQKSKGKKPKKSSS